MSYAGSFYPADREILRTDIDSYMAAVPERKSSGEIISLIVPHAGYVYSGPVAAYSYAAVAGKKYDYVIVLAPSHHARFNGCSVPPKGMYETPFGMIPIDEKITSVIGSQPYTSFIKEIDAREHSLEVQLPFLQYAIGDFSVVPIIIGTTDPSICEEIAKGICEAVSNDTRSCLIVISTDLSHYYDYRTAVRIDSVFLDALSSFSNDRLKKTLNDESEACGEGPVMTGMSLSRLLGAKKVEILKYANSGDTAGDKMRVVGYSAAAFVR
jgi:AmmeMemoRadiSam system protein B